MKKLIAKNPVLYQGRTFAPGEALPAQDPRMVKAWLAGNTAEWQNSTASADAAVKAVLASKANDGQAAAVLSSMGVVLEDENGDFVGEAKIEEQLQTIFAARMSASDAQGGQNTPDGSEGQDGQESATAGATDAESGQNATGAEETVAGHLDAEDLEKTMTRADLDKLAADMGLNTSECKNKGDVARLIASAPVQAPADEKTGGAQ